MADETDKNTKSGERVASPFSTGGGTAFEMKVESSLLAALLVRAHVPGMEGALVRELHLQSERLGYETDDALLIAVDAHP